MIVAAAPVANRPWAISEWFRCLAEQTHPPDLAAFIWTPTRPADGFDDPTFVEIKAASANYGIPAKVLPDYASRIHPRHDNERFATLVHLRNTLKAWVRLTYAPEYYLSLDTDILLEDPATIEHLLCYLENGWDLIAPATWLHPAGKGSWAMNAGWWLPDGTPGDPHRAWARVDQTTYEQGIASRAAIRVDFAFAVWMAQMGAIAPAQYRWHEACEDLGFAHDLVRLGLRVCWDPTIETRHVWDETAL